MVNEQNVYSVHCMLYLSFSEIIQCFHTHTRIVSSFDSNTHSNIHIYIKYAHARTHFILLRPLICVYDCVCVYCSLAHFIRPFVRPSVCPPAHPFVRSFVALLKNTFALCTRVFSLTHARAFFLSPKLCVKKNSSAFISVFLSFFGCVTYTDTHTHTTYRTLYSCSKIFCKYLHAKWERTIRNV